MLHFLIGVAAAIFIGATVLWIIVGLSCVFLLHQIARAVLTGDPWQVDDREDFMVDLRERKR